jgi:hypothetical protein
MIAFGIVNSTILSKLSLSEGGGGWRKTSKILSEITISLRKSGNFPGCTDALILCHEGIFADLV